MSAIAAEIVIRLMDDGKIAAKWSKCGPMALFGMLEIARDLIRKDEDAGKQSPSLIAPASQLPPDFNPMRLKPEDIPPMMGNNGK